MAGMNSEFIAAGGNRHPSVGDWDSSGILAFGANNNIALWSPLDQDSRGIKRLLSGHADVVNVTRFLKSESTGKTFLISGSSDKTVRVWVRNDESLIDFNPIKVLTEHQGSVTCMATLPGCGIFFTGSSDSSVKAWRIGQNETTATEVSVNLVQSIQLSRFFPLAISAVQLDKSSMLLAVGGTKSTIQIYISRDDEFTLAATLTGHEGWIRSLDFTQEEQSGDYLLASASQDKYIRLWRIHSGEELPTASTAINDPALGILGRSLSNKAHRFETNESKYSVTFEALLLGHEDWIFSVKWRPTKSKLQLLSTSADNSLAVWEPDPISGIWVSVSRLGEISSQKGATTATGSAGGFWIGLWSPLADAVVCLGRTGSWRLWKYDPQTDTWSQQVAITGHAKEVKSLGWAKDGSYLLSTGSDQTTRLFAEWKRNDTLSWHEFSRPQIHGYDLNCVDSISPTRFISGADEKLLRVFDEPSALATILEQVCGIKTGATEALPDAANIPVLGLSNKAIQAVDDNAAATVAEGQVEQNDAAVDPASIVHKSTLDIKQPPFEDHLARHLLWPECEKLYGHGYEISAVATSQDGSVVATVCRASSVDHAVIRLYDTKEWREIKPPLKIHSLTVTSLEFSQDDNYLLSVGRDRQWAIFARTAGTTEYALAISNPKGHSRMILDCSWAPKFTSGVFATAGRDKLVKIWEIVNNEATCKQSLATESPVTAVAFLQDPTGEEDLTLAYGTEDGTVAISRLVKDTFAVTETQKIDSSLTPSKYINRLAWRPQIAHQEGRQLAIASDDTSLRIINIPGVR